MPADRLGVFDLRVAQDDLRQRRHGLPRLPAAAAAAAAATHALVVPLAGVEVFDELNGRIDRRNFCKALVAAGMTAATASDMAEHAALAQSIQGAALASLKSE